MFYIICALSCEAKPLVLSLSLRKDQFSCPFETYVAEDRSCALVVSGPGALAAASATTYLLTRFGFHPQQDFLLNIGSCAGQSEGLHLIHKITDSATGRTFYPDMSYDLSDAGLPITSEKALTTCYQVVSSLDDPDTLCDMEGAGIYQAASHFAPPHRMIFLKFVSDTGVDDRGSITPKDLTRMAEQYVSSFTSVIEKLSDACEVLPDRNEACFAQTCDELCASETMRNELQQLFRYAQASEQDMEAILADMHQKGQLPARSKREGKVVLDEIRQRLM